MTKQLWSLTLAMVAGACGLEPDDLISDDLQPEVAERFAYTPMAFARVTGLGGLVTSMNSASAAPSAVTASRSAPGSYTITFTGLPEASGYGADGNVQVTAEGTTNVHCRAARWSGTTTVTASVRCATPAGTLADSPFAIMFHRYPDVRRNAFPTRAAYLLVLELGWVNQWGSYNSSGAHNTVTRDGQGRYRIGITNATATNASMMVTTVDAGGICTLVGWGPGTANVDCVDQAGTHIDLPFSFSYSTTGPVLEQQGAHAWFSTRGTISPSYSSALGKFTCGASSVSGSLSGSLASIAVTGDLGSHGTAPFLRASFVSGYGSPKYCKVESQSVTGTAPTSTGTARVRCYSPSGAVLATPTFTFTQVTSDAAGPC